MRYSTQQLTEYANEYLSGSNLVPIGVLDNPEFKRICQKLWGPTPTAREVQAHHNRVLKQISRLESARAQLVGPRGGRPKSGQALANYKQLEWLLAGLRREVA
jgi:hypothetical protein